MDIKYKIKDLLNPERRNGKKRSSKWPKIRKEFLLENPVCACCGSDKDLNVHHIIPFHISPALELEKSNLITLCEGKNINCHISVGHLQNYKDYNENVTVDAEYIRNMLSRKHK